MAKETDLNVILEAAANELRMEGSELLDFLTIEDAAMCMTLIYVTNDEMSGFAQDFDSNVHVISSPKRISVIYQGHHSFYKTEGQVCNYEDLAEDMEQIRVMIDAALQRWEELRL